MRKLLIPLAACVVLVTGCSRFTVPILPGLAPYRMEVQQGNYVTQDMVAKLKPGMTRNQVKFALGTPLIADPFHNDRWDYVYVLQRQGRVVEQRRIVVVFKEDKLERIDGDVQPAGTGATAESSRMGGSK